ncbi:MAG TPA: DUF5677 domain-containing protein [Planctomycetota bacterium]|nr:DUF5677 domain-containing protein [Planctomycetota bacterium]
MRIDIAESINKITFPDHIWEWIDVLGDVIATTQEEALKHEDFLANTDFKKLLVVSLNKEISTLNAIYLLLRCEWIHQAAAQARIFCEGVITLKYITQDSNSRAKSFNEYSKIETYERILALLEWERDKAIPTIVKQIENLRIELEPEYTKLKVLYQYMGHNGKQRPFRNWCNKTMPQQAEECGKDIEKLYSLVYKQMSAYIHGSAWSLRRQLSYSRKNYKEDVVLVDIATVVRTTIVIWLELVKFCDSQLGWKFSYPAQLIINKLETLDIKYLTEKQNYTDTIPDSK